MKNDFSTKSIKYAFFFAILAKIKKSYDRTHEKQKKAQRFMLFLFFFYAFLKHFFTSVLRVILSAPRTIYSYNQNLFLTK